jgi:hypothetical protein
METIGFDCNDSFAPQFAHDPQAPFRRLVSCCQPRRTKKPAEIATIRMAMTSCITWFSFGQCAQLGGRCEWSGEDVDADLIRD